MIDDLVKRARLTALMHADGTPVDSADALLLEMADRIEELEAALYKVKEIAADIECLIYHGMTRRAFEDMKALYEGAKLAGLTE